MGSGMLPKNNSLIKSSGTDSAGIGFFTSVNPLVLSESSSISKGFIAKLATIRFLSSVDTHMNLLGAPRTERLSTCITREALSRNACMRVSVVRQRSSIGKFLITNIADNRFISMTCHVTFKAGFVMKVLSTLRAKMIFITRMIPGVFYQSFTVSTFLATQNTWVLSHKSIMMIV